MIDTSSLFLHILAAIGILGGGIVQIVAGFRLRTAATARELATWARFTGGAGRLVFASAAVSLLTGGHLAGAVWTTDARSGFSFPFITIGMAGLLLLAPIGPMLGGSRLRRLAEAAESAGDGRAPEGLLADARSPRLWGPIYSLVGIGIGFEAIMVYKPDWGAGAALLVATFAAGWGAGAAAATRKTPVGNEGAGGNGGA
jgi:hypothetical protein